MTSCAQDLVNSLLCAQGLLLVHSRPSTVPGIDLGQPYAGQAPYLLFGATPNGAQGQFLALCSGVIP